MDGTKYQTAFCYISSAINPLKSNDMNVLDNNLEEKLRPIYGKVV